MSAVFDSLCVPCGQIEMKSYKVENLIREQIVLFPNSVIKVMITLDESWGYIGLSPLYCLCKDFLSDVVAQNTLYWQHINTKFFIGDLDLTFKVNDGIQKVKLFFRFYPFSHILTLAHVLVYACKI